MQYIYIIKRGKNQNFINSKLCEVNLWVKLTIPKNLKSGKKLFYCKIVYGAFVIDNNFHPFSRSIFLPRKMLFKAYNFPSITFIWITRYDLQRVFSISKTTCNQDQSIWSNFQHYCKMGQPSFEKILCICFTFCLRN